MRVGKRELQIRNRAIVGTGRSQQIGILKIQQDIARTWIGGANSVCQRLRRLTGLPGAIQRLFIHVVVLSFRGTCRWKSHIIERVVLLFGHESRMPADGAVPCHTIPDLAHEYAVHVPDYSPTFSSTILARTKWGGGYLYWLLSLSVLDTTVSVLFMPVLLDRNRRFWHG